MNAPENELPIWVIFHNPTDYPGKYVVRVQRAGPGTLTNDPMPRAVVNTLEAARAAIPSWCVCLGRKLDDVPQIVEVWL